jgi:hypothetical protein
MAKQILLFVTAVVFGWALIASFSSHVSVANSRERTMPAPVPRSSTTGGSGSIENARPPVPWVRAGRAAVTSQAELKIAVPSETTDELDKRAAHVAVEMDGYKRVSIIGKTSNGAWRAKAYRGTMEVLLAVDGTGRVSMQ